MMKPGPRPKATAPRSTHIAFTDNERKILNNMGSGDVKSKIRALLVMESDRQSPKSKTELIARWILAREEAKQKAAYCNAILEKMRDLGITEEEIERVDGENAES